MNPLPSTILSVLFLCAGLVALYTMMSLQGGRKVSNPAFYRTLHKIMGYTFATLFLVMFTVMLWRVEAFWEESSPRIALHVTLAVTIFFLLTVKVLIPRFFPRLGSNLFSLGIIIYALSFSLVGITAGYYVIWKAREKPYISHAQKNAHIMTEDLGKNLFITECSLCHVLNDIMKPRGVENWEKVINEMVELAAPRITPDEANQIFYYLSKTHVPKPSEVPGEPTILGTHCFPCHTPTELYKHQHSRSEWAAIVAQMNSYDPDTVPVEKVDEIVKYLSENQKRE